MFSLDMDDPYTDGALAMLVVLRCMAGDQGYPFIMATVGAIAEETLWSIEDEAQRQKATSLFLDTLEHAMDQTREERLAEIAANE